MGLAPYGEPKYAKLIKENLIQIGMMKLSAGYELFQFCGYYANNDLMLYLMLTRTSVRTNSTEMDLARLSKSY